VAQGGVTSKNTGQILFHHICRFLDVRCGVGCAQESRLELRWRKVNTVLEAAVEEFSEARTVTAHGLLEIPHRPLLKIETKHRADPLEGEGKALNRLTRGSLEGRPGFFEESPTADTLHFAQLGKTRRHCDGISRKCSCLVNGAVWREAVHDFCPSSKGSHRQAAANDFPHRREVRSDFEYLLRAAWSEAEAGHDLVEYQNSALACADFSQAVEEAWLRQIKAGIGRDGLDNHCRDLSRIRRKGGLDGRGVVEGECDGEPCERLRHACAIGVAMGERAAAGFDKERVHMPVIAALEFDDLGSAGEPSGEAYAAHGGLGAAVHHAHFFHRRHHAADRLGHFDFQRIRSAKAQSTSRRFTHRLNDRIGRMTKDRRSPCSYEIDQLAVIHRGQSAPTRRLHKKRIATHAPEGSNRRVHPAGDAFFCGFKKLSGYGHGNRA